MRCVRVLVLLLLLVTVSCWAQQVVPDNTEELPLPQQQVALRRRRVSDLADTEGEEGDVATPEEGDEERLPTPNRPNRQRNPNRRRRKRKRIPPPRPLYEDYEDTLAFPTTGDRPGVDADAHEHDERPRAPPTGPEHRSLPGDRRRPPPSRDDEEDDDDDHRPLRRDRTRSPDREGQPSIQRPFREQHPYLVGEDGEPRAHPRPLRRRRKNRRRPPIAAIGPPEGIVEEPVGEADSTPKEAPEDILDDVTQTELTLKTPLTEEVLHHRQIEDIPLGSLRGEVRLPIHARRKHRPPVIIEVGTAEVVEPGAGRDLEEVTRGPQTTPESLPAENLPAFNFDNHPPRMRRRRLRPRGHNRTTTTEKPEESATEPEEKMLADREPLRPREPATNLRKEQDHEDSFPAATSGKDEDDEVRETSIVSGDITLETTPIKISLSDLLREKNISIEEILKEAEDDEPPPPPPRFQRPLKPRPPPPTPKTIVTPKLTQLSRVHQFLQKPKLDETKKDTESKVQTHDKDATTTTSTTTTHRTHIPSTHRTNPPTTTTTTAAPATTTNTATTHRKFTPTTLTTQPRFHTTSTTSTSNARDGITRRTTTIDKEEVTEKVVGRPVGFGAAGGAARAPALNMQETEDIDPVKMTGKVPLVGVRTGGNSKAAEFLKSRVRLPPSSVSFPSVKPGGTRGGHSPPSAPNRLHAPKGGRPTASAPPPHNAESNKVPVVAGSEAVLAHANVPVYVLNPKYYKASQPKVEARPASPTETNVIPEPEVVTQTFTTTEGVGVTDADPVRLNIPLKSRAEGEGEVDKSERGSGQGKSAEDEIVELLETENGSSRLSRILASRNMTLSELIEHRERGASQQHISDIFLRGEESKATPTVPTEEEPTTEAQQSVPITREVIKNPAKKLNVEIVQEDQEEEDEEENSKRVPRVFEGLVPVPELEFKDSYPEGTLEVGTDYAIETYRTNGKHENPGKVREIVTKVSDDEGREEFAGLPSGTKSAILASSAVLGLAIFVFLAIFVTCKVRRRQSVRRRYANRSPILSHDVEKSRSMTPVLRHSGYKDMTEERRYYLWNTIRKTLRYK